MAKPNALVKVSGSLLKNNKVFDWLKDLEKDYSITVLVGGGDQINEAFKEKGFPIRFGLLGRETETPEERQIARDVLEINQAYVQDILQEQGITARVEIPIHNIGTVLCPVNGDLEVLVAYLGYDKLYILTTEKGLSYKKIWLDKIYDTFKVTLRGTQDEITTLKKLEIVAF